MGDVSCFGEVSEEAEDGTSLFAIGMKLLRDDDPIEVVGEDALVVLIFSGGGLQSTSHELLPLFLRFVCSINLTPALINWERV